MINYKALFEYVLARMKEPSSLVALGVIFGILGVHVDAVALQAVCTVATLLFSGLGFAVKG